MEHHGYASERLISVPLCLCVSWARVATELLSPRSLHPLVRLLVLQTELVDQIRIELDVLRERHGERLRIVLRIVDRQLDLERAEIGPADPFGHHGLVAHRAAPRVDPEIVTKPGGGDDERVAVPVRG